MRIDTIFIVLPISTYGTTTHDGLADDEGWLAYRCFGFTKCLANSIGTATIDFKHMPAPSLVLCNYIFAIYLLDGSGELDVVSVIVHDEVIESEMPCDTTSTLRDFFLDASIRDVGVDGLAHDPAQTMGEELCCDGCTDSEGMSLPKRPRGVFDPTKDIYLGVPRGRASPLAELLELLHRIATKE